MQKPNDKDAPNKTRCCAVPSCGKTVFAMPSLEWMNFIFNEDPDCVSKNSFLCSLHFSTDLFINKAQFEAGFSERLNLKDDAMRLYWIQL